MIKKEIKGPEENFKYKFIAWKRNFVLPKRFRNEYKLHRILAEYTEHLQYIIV